MKRSAGIIAVVLLLALVGTVFLTAGLFDRRMAIAQEDMAVLDFVDPKVEYAALEQDLEKYRWVPPTHSRVDIAGDAAGLAGDFTDLLSRAAAADEEKIHRTGMQVLAQCAVSVASGAPDRPTLLNISMLRFGVRRALRAATGRGHRLITNAVECSGSWSRQAQGAFDRQNEATNASRTCTASGRAAQGLKWSSSRSGFQWTRASQAKPRIRAAARLRVEDEEDGDERLIDLELFGLRPLYLCLLCAGCCSCLVWQVVADDRARQYRAPRLVPVTNAWPP